MISFSVCSVHARQNDPFESKLDIILKGNPSEPLFPTGAQIQSAPFKLNAIAIPDKVAQNKDFTVRVTFDIAPGHQLYADKTYIKPAAMSGLIFGQVKTTSATFEKNDPYQGKILIYKEQATFELPVSVALSADPGPVTIMLEAGYLGCTETVCFLPEKKNLNVAFTIIPATEAFVADIPEPIIQDTPPDRNPFQEAADKFGVLGVLFAAFIWGLFASLTPCVYPMIPVTVSVIGAGSRGSVSRGFVLSLFYVLGLSLTYAIFGTIAAWSGSLFGEYANHPAVRIIVAGVFVILALGLFDLFYIQVPSAISSKLGGQTGAGIIGVFLTGAAAGAVVGPCVGPMLVALLVYIAAIGSKLQGFLIMWHFALGMGMLFLVIGTFSGAAASLPKAGPWMENLKRFFGVLMLAVALYYVKPLLSENIFMLCVGIFLIGIGVFVGGLDALTADSAVRDRVWKTVGIVCLAVGIAYAARFALDDQVSLPRVSSPKAGITWLKDENAALVKARQEKKPVMMDFYADWCAACKKLERETFASPAVADKAKQFVCVKIDCTDTTDPVIRQIQDKYRIVGLPTIMFMNSLGRPLPAKSVTEFVDPVTLLARMRQVEQIK
ncbi:protein-disulfide reductase DsbD family protein [Desulfonema magnum]|nr:protein-disulfide reductase DsbD [Desulfonema magnum]